MIIHNDIEQGSEEWHALRAGIPTASVASKLVTSKGEPSKQMEALALELAVDAYAGEPVDAWEGNKWTERGHEMEDRARAYYENTFPDREVTRVAFITRDDGLAGCSPDSLVDDDGMLEIKCLKGTNHAKVLVHYSRYSRLPSDYIAQPQMQMQIAERKYCDSLFWHPDLPALIIRNTPDEKIQINLRLQIMSCIDARDKVLEVLRNA